MNGRKKGREGERIEESEREGERMKERKGEITKETDGGGD